MTTQQTFETLVDRVSVATDKLETAVTAVELGTGEMTVLVERAEQAEAGAIAASEIANEAAVDAVAAKDIILNTPLLPEAPEDGKTYGRSNAAWVQVTSGGGGGSGTVQSVNEVTPDEEGNVTLTPADIGAANASHTHLSTQISDSTAIGRNVLKATTEAIARGAIGAGTSDLAIGTTATTAAAGNHTHNMASTSTNGFMAATDKVKLNAIETEATKGADWNTNVTNKPTIPTNTNQLTNGAGFITDAPSDGKEYVRKDAAWAESSGGGGETQLKFLHPTQENGWEYNFGSTATPDWQPVDYYPDDSYHATGMLRFRRRGAPHAGGINTLPSTGQEGDPIVWNQIFSTASYIQAIPPGKYWFHTTNFTNTVGGAALYNKTGYIIVHGAQSSAGLKRAEAHAYDTTTNIPSIYYWKSDGTWNKAV